MLLDELDGGDTLIHRDAMEARVHFSKMSPWSACTPSPPSPSQACQRVGPITMNCVSVMSYMACSSHFVSHGHMCIVM